VDRLIGDELARAVLWYGDGRLAAGLTLPRLRDGWGQPRNGRPERSGTFRFTAPERDAIYHHAARQAAAAAEHLGRCAHGDPSGAADAAWAAADMLHVAARALRSPGLRCAADAYDRAARAPHGRVPHRTRDGDQLRATARPVALLGNAAGDGTLASAVLIANLVALAGAVGELREAQQHAAQAAAARKAAEHLHATVAQARPAARAARARAPRRPGVGADTVPGDFLARHAGSVSGRRECSRGIRWGDRKGHRDICGFAWAVAVVYDSSRAAVQVDQAIQQFQAPALFVVGGCVLADRATCPSVVDFGPQVAAGIGHADLDWSLAVAHGVGDQLADDEFGESCVFGNTPSGKRLAGDLAGTPDLDRIMAKLTGSRKLTCHDRHSRLPCRKGSS
jgi:hypothetical protein